MMGEVVDGADDICSSGWLDVEPARPPDWARGAAVGARTIEWSQVRFEMRPFEIATIMADLVMGRKQWRDLDARREVWAKVHKQPPPSPSRPQPPEARS